MRSEKCKLNFVYVAFAFIVVLATSAVGQAAALKKKVVCSGPADGRGISKIDFLWVKEDGTLPRNFDYDYMVLNSIEINESEKEFCRVNLLDKSFYDKMSVYSRNRILNPAHGDFVGTGQTILESNKNVVPAWWSIETAAGARVGQILLLFVINPSGVMSCSTHHFSAQFDFASCQVTDIP